MCRHRWGNSPTPGNYSRGVVTPHTASASQLLSAVKYREDLGKQLKLKNRTEEKVTELSSITTGIQTWKSYDKNQGVKTKTRKAKPKPNK